MRTYLQRNTILDQLKLNTDEQSRYLSGLGEFHPSEILLNEQHFDPKGIPLFKRFVQIKRIDKSIGEDALCLLKYLMILFLLFYSGKLYSQKYDINFTLADGAQSHQIAFNGLGFITGDFCACTFIPPGKVADYFGFQYLRDNDITQMGHNSDFSGVIGDNLLYVLNDTQKAKIIALAKAQVEIIKQYAYLRFPLIDAFIRMRDKSMPTGSLGLDSTAVCALSSQIYRVDGRICFQRAQLYAEIINSFTEDQKAYLDSISKIGMNNMPRIAEEDKIDKQGLNNNEFVGIMSIADDIYSWYVGNIDADVYFCPERQGNYFGSFYLKDAPAMGNPNYSIDTTLSQDGGTRFLETLNTSQKATINELYKKQNTTLNTLVNRRTDLSKLLRSYLTGATVDTTEVLLLSEEYGQLDGLISYWYATNFSKVNWTLTDSQKDTLMKIRNLDDYPCNGAYLYSDPISKPTIQNTDFLFLTSSVGEVMVSVSLNNDNAGTVTGAQSYHQGDTVVLTATPTIGYTFTNWTENGIPVSTNAIYSFTATSNITLVANFQSTVKVQNSAKENSIVVFPNPATNILSIEGTKGDVSISILDIVGKLVVNKKVSKNQIEIADLLNGLYFIKIQDENNIVIKIFVKQ